MKTFTSALDVQIGPANIIPSAACVVTASTVPVRGHPCRCKVPPRSHVNDLVVKAAATMSQHKVTAMVKAARIILKHAQGACSGSTLPDQAREQARLSKLSKYLAQPEAHRANTYPTGERERQKVRPKALRGAGQEPKR